MRVVDLKIVQSFLLRVRTREVVVMRSLQHTAEVVGEDPIGEIHSAIEVAFFHACIITGLEGNVQTFLGFICLCRSRAGR